MIALTCDFTTRAGFTTFERLAAPIALFRGLTEFALTTARIVRLSGLRCPVTRFQRLIGYMFHRYFTW
jgi:hypothetical protein